MYFKRKIGIMVVGLSLITGLLFFKPSQMAYAAAPTATIVMDKTSLKIGDTSLVTFKFSEAVAGFTSDDLTAPNGTVTGVSSSDGGVTWTATFTPTVGVEDTTNVITLDNTGVSNSAGNAGTGTTTSNNYTIDTVRPTSTMALSDTTIAAGQTSLVTITFSEAVTGFDNADLTVSNGTLSPVQSSDGGVTWTATFTPTVGIEDTTNVITLDNTGISDVAGNAGRGITTSNNYIINTIRPTATIVVAETPLTIGKTSLVTITFSEAVTGFTSTDLTAPNGTVTGVSSSDGGVTWTATFTPTVGIEDTTNVITLDNAGVSNSAGNAGTGTTTSNNYTIDTVRPTATIVVAETPLTIGKTSLVTITFSEAVTGFTSADLTAPNGTVTGVSSSDGGITWTATFTPAVGIEGTTNVITLDNTGVSDIAGNAGRDTTTSNNYTIDTVRPTSTMVLSDTTIAAGQTSLVTITFSEAVTGFDNADLTVSNGTLSPVQSSDGGVTWTATFTPTAGIEDTTNVITLDNTGVSDIAGNAGKGITTSNNYKVNTIRPTATIVVAETPLTIGKTSLVTITFSEAVTGFDNADLTVPNGTLSPVQSSDGGVTWTATLTPQINVNNSTNLITLQNNGVSNLDGNTGEGVTDSNPYAVFTVQSVPTPNPSTSSPSEPYISAAPVDNTVTSTTGKITVSTGKSGIVSLGKDVQISIPEGASSQELTLSIDKVLNTETLLTKGETLISPVFELLKNFTQDFQKPVKVTFAFDSTKLKSHQMAAVFYYDEVNKTWVKVNGGIIKGDQISVEVSHFTKFAVLAVDETSGQPILSNPVSLPVEHSYSDIKGHWAETEIKQASGYGIITGYPDGTFRPGKNVTRAEFSVMLMSALKSNKAGVELSFSDTTEIGAWAKTAVSQAVQSGIISGYPDGTFQPNAVLTRAEMVTMVASALHVSREAQAHAATSFADEKIIPVWAKTSVTALKERGIVKGMGVNEFKPNAQTTRAEAVVLLKNMLEQTQQSSK